MNYENEDKRIVYLNKAIAHTEKTIRKFDKKLTNPELDDEIRYSLERDIHRLECHRNELIDELVEHNSRMATFEQ